MVHHVMGVDGYYPYLLALWLLPLLGAILNFAFGPQLKRLAGPLGSAAVGAAFVATLLVLARWHARRALRRARIKRCSVGSRDSISACCSIRSRCCGRCIITGVGFLIHVYSIGYMDGDKAFARFFAY